MALKGGNIVSAILIFLTGVIFSHYTYPFFNSLLTALDGVTGTAFDGWADVKLILWGGYILILGLWILVFPAYKIFSQEDTY